MTDEEKDIEEYLNSEDTQMQLEIASEIATIVQLLCQKNIITEKEFNETNNAIKEVFKETMREKIKQDLKNMDEE